jgi:signal peptidase I
MNFLQRRRYRKLVKHVLHEAQHARHMREDVADAAALSALYQAENQLKEAWRTRDAGQIDAAVDEVGQKLDVVQPPHRHPRWRENIEVIAVALAVAMGFRTYFIQPFKIPTGSMQPTLYGITVKPQAGKLWYDHFPLNLVSMSLFGDRYVEVRAKASGRVDPQVDMSDENMLVRVSGQQHMIPRDMPLNVTPGQSVVLKGQVLASGRVRLGDHIFVNKVRYNFTRPERGDIFVFSTRDIKYPRIRPDAFYIKRLAGMPGDALQLDPPYLVANGKRVTDPYPFKRLVEDTADGYHGYQLPSHNAFTPAVLGSRLAVFTLKQDEYLPLGDNTGASLDGRYFGAVNQRSVVGPAFAVYWPFSARWGFIQ